MEARASSLPVSATGCLLLVIAAWGALFSNGWFALAFGAPAMVLALVVLPCVFMFNRPKAFVPPALRTEPGRLRDRN